MPGIGAGFEVRGSRFRVRGPGYGMPIPRTPNPEPRTHFACTGREHRVDIRTLTEADAAAYYALRLRALTEEPEAFGSSPEEYAVTPLATVAEKLRPSDAVFYLGAWMPALVGCVRFMREEGRKDQHKAFIYGMYVAPEARGQGIGRALLQETLARAAALPGLEQI